MKNSYNTFKEIEPLTSEFKQLESSLKKNTLAFQRLPFHKRRRSRALIKKSRRRKLDGNPSRRYYAKRFRMLKIEKEETLYIPYTRREKSYSFIQKSKHRGFVYDISHKKIYFTRKKVQGVHEKYGDVAVSEECVKIECIDVDLQHESNELKKSYGENNEMESSMEKNVYFPKDIGSMLLLYSPLSGQYTIENGLTPLDPYFSGHIPKNSFFVFKKDFTSLLICRRSDFMKIFMFLVVRGTIPIGLDELENLFLFERKNLYPLDFICKDFYLYEKQMFQDLHEKERRRPPSKKLNKEYFYKGNSKNIFYFFMHKGTAERMDVIQKDNKEVGRVLKGVYMRERGCVIGKAIGTGIDSSCVIVKKNNLKYNIEVLEKKE